MKTVTGHPDLAGAAIRSRRAPVSSRAKLLSRLAAAGVALLIAAQLVAAHGLPWLCRHSSIWQRHREVQELFRSCDALQSQLDDFKPRDAVTVAYVDAVAAELRGRRDYLQGHAMEMDDAQRRKMMDNIRRTSDLLERMAAAPEGSLTPPLPELSIEAPVRAIINERQ